MPTKQIPPRVKAQDKQHTQAAETTPPPPTRARRGYGPWLAVTAGLVCLSVYLLRFDRVIGLMADDAWYVLLAKSIATGQGFTLINSPSPGIMPFYPPGFPFLLSLVFRVAPHFPQNLWLLKGVSVIAMFGLGAACYWYFTRYRELPRALSAAIALSVVLHPVLVFLSTSAVMTEPVFMLAQMLAVILIERCVRTEALSKAWRWAAAGAALASFAFLTRSAGVTLLGAVVCYLLKERRLGAAGVFVAGVALFVGPWMIHTKRHAPTEAQRAEQGGYIMYPYTEQFWMKVAGNPLVGTVSAGDIPQRVWDNGVQIAGEDVGRMLAVTLFRSYRLSGYEMMGYRNGVGILSFILSAVTLLGFVAVVREKVTLAEFITVFTLGLTLLWPWYPLRFLIPSLPFVVFYFLRGVRVVQQAYQWMKATPGLTAQPAAVLAVAGIILGLSLYDHTAYILARFKNSPDESPVLHYRFRENEAALVWMRENIPQDGGVVVSSNPPLIHLYTGLKTISGGDVRKSWEAWKQMNVRYLAYVGNPEPFPARTRGEQAFRLIYPPTPDATAPATDSKNTRLTNQAGGQNPYETALMKPDWNLRVVDLGPPETRPAWGGRDSVATGSK
jgi:hypothetical protein